MLTIAEIDEKPLQGKNCPQQAQHGRKRPIGAPTSVFGMLISSQVWHGLYHIF